MTATGANPEADLSRPAVVERLARVLGPHRVPGRFKIVADTSDFFRVDYHDVVILGQTPYLISTCEREGRFGLDDEPKHWVRRATDLDSGATVILKMVFLERFQARVGGIVFDCYRSPKKEARILDLVRGDLRFMQGRWVADAGGNVVRILDYIRGVRFDDWVLERAADHQRYFQSHLREVLVIFLELARAIAWLHEHGEKHGDIRRDHILLDRERGLCRWIDFDFDYVHHGESMAGYDLFGLGSILIFLVGGGDVTLDSLAATRPAVVDRLRPEDGHIIFKNRVASLRKVYPYLPGSLDFILRHFSQGAEIFYDHADQFLADLGAAIADLPAGDA
ncbi:MAG: hypothetical protein AB1634_09035 [Thermodesulfobacteriota bacterium]